MDLNTICKWLTDTYSKLDEQSKNSLFYHAVGNAVDALKKWKEEKNVYTI